MKGIAAQWLTSQEGIRTHALGASRGLGAQLLAASSWLTSEEGVLHTDARRGQGRCCNLARVKPLAGRHHELLLSTS